MRHQWFFFGTFSDFPFYAQKAIIMRVFPFMCRNEFLEEGYAFNTYLWLKFQSLLPLFFKRIFSKVYTIMYKKWFLRQKSIYIYIYNTQILSVCMIGYILDPWRSYRHETGIITFSMTWRGAIGKIFLENWNFSKRLHHQCFSYGKILMLYDFMFGRWLFGKFFTMFKKILIFQKRLRHQCL
jgi:hypothetical protein